MGLNRNLGQLTEVITEQNGRIGIGTANPRGKLEVTGQSYLYEMWNENGLYFGDFSQGAANTYILGLGGNTGPQYLDFAVNFTSRMRIANGGNVGIGTINPESTLVVQKNTSAGRGGELSIVNLATAAVGAESALNFGLEASTYGGNNCNFQIKGYLNNTNGATDAIFSNWSGSAFLERMRISSNGNVGIGTINPSYPLHVASPSTYHITAEQTSTDTSSASAYATFYAINNAGSAQVRGLFGAGGNNVANTALRNAVYYGAQSNHATVFLSNDSERMRITSGGDLGIGTSTPDYRLKVVTSSIFTGGFQSSGGETILQINNTASNGRNWYVISGGTTGSFSGGKFGIYNATNFVEAFTILPVGNVGIGNINPLSSLGRTLTVEGTGIFQNNISGGNYNENLRLNRSLNGYSSIAMGGIYNSTSGTGVGQWTLAATPSNLGHRFDFDYNGSAVSNVNTSGAYTQVSDRNKKKDFEESTIGLDAILRIKPTLYRMKTDEDTADKQLGFVAQEVREQIPQAYTETSDGFIGLNHVPIIAALVKGMQEQQEIIGQLTNRIINLENK